MTSLGHILFEFSFVFHEVRPNVKISKQNNQGNQVHATETQVVSTEATINVKGGECVNQNCHELNLCKR